MHDGRAERDKKSTSRHEAKKTARSGRIGHGRVAEEADNVYGELAWHKTSELVVKDMKIMEPQRAQRTQREQP